MVRLPSFKLRRLSNLDSHLAFALMASYYLWDQIDVLTTQTLSSQTARMPTRHSTTFGPIHAEECNSVHQFFLWFEEPGLERPKP